MGSKSPKGGGVTRSTSKLLQNILVKSPNSVKNPYNWAKGNNTLNNTPTKRKLIFAKNTKTLINKFEAKSEHDLPGGVISESPAKRGKWAATRVNDL